VPDDAMTQPIERKLVARGYGPGEHFADSGYVTAAAVVVADSYRRGTPLRSTPTPVPPSLRVS